MSISKTNRSSSLISIALLISPFLIYLGINNPYEFPKFVFFLIFSQGLAIYLFIKAKKIKLDLLTKLIILFLCVTFIANLLGLDPRISLLGSEWRHQGFLLLLSCFIFYLASKTIKNPELITKSIIISSIFLSTISITEFILLELGFYFPTYNGRIVATMGNPNFLAGYIALTLPFLLTYSKSIKLTSFFTALCFFTIYITGSRGALIATSIVLLIFLYYKLKDKLPKLFSLLLFVIIIFLGFIFISKTINTMYQTPISNYKLTEDQRKQYCLSLLPPHEFPWKVFRLYYETHPNVLARDSLCESRVIIWIEGSKAVFNKPLLGYGQENFELIFPKRFDTKIDNAHNFILETAISVGLIGLGILLSIILLSLKNSSIIGKMFIASFLIVGFFNPLFISGIVLFWIVIGLENRKTKRS